MTSNHKKRFDKDGFSLDLVYMTPKIIVHGFPSVGLEHFYRNPRGEIRRFLDHYHRDHYKVYNFCCEPGRGYDPREFYGRVERYPFKDHFVPTLEAMVEFGESAKMWLDADPKNVINMHCKAGKGRAGLMCCIALMRTGVCNSAQEALAYYDKRRVHNGRALTVTSQRKYVIFYEILWRKHWNIQTNIGDFPALPPGSNKRPIPTQPDMDLFGVSLIDTNPRLQLKGLRIKIYEINRYAPVLVHDTGASHNNSMSASLNLKLTGNFKVRIEAKKGIMGKSVKYFELLHNTCFVNRYASHIDFRIDQLDIKKKVIREMGAGFALRLHFGQSEPGKAEDWLQSPGSKEENLAKSAEYRNPSPRQHSTR